MSIVLPRGGDPRGSGRRYAPDRARGGASPAVVTGASPRASPPPRASLRENFGWTLAGNVVYAGSQWAILVLLARLASPEAVGTFALGTAITAPLFLFAGLQLRSAQATDAAGRHPFADYLVVRSGGMLAALLAAAALVPLAARRGGEAGLVLLAIALAKAVEGMTDLSYGVLQQRERMRPMAVSLVWRGLSSVAAVALVLAAGGGLALATAALAASWLAVLVLHDRPAARSLLAPAERRLALDGRRVRELVATCLPLGLVIMLVSLRTNVPRYFVEGVLGTAALGVFAALASLLVAGTVIVSALGQAATPRLARHLEDGDVPAFRRLVRRLLLVGGAVGAAGIGVAALAGGPLLRLVFGEAYAAHAPLLLLLMGMALVSYASSFLGYALTAARRFAVQLPLFGATTVACVAASAWLVPAYGLSGAAWAWGLSLALELVATAAVLERTLRARRARPGGAP